MDGLPFQGMPRIALTPAEEALIPRPHSSASQVATAVPSAYTRNGSTTSFPSSHSRRPFASPYYSSSPPSTSSVVPGTSTVPASDLSLTTGTDEVEYPQNPREDSFSFHHPHPRPSSPGPPRLSFSLSPRPARPPSPQLYNQLYHTPSSHQSSPSTSYPYRSSYDGHPRPGSPLQQEHRDSWDSAPRVESPTQFTESGSESDAEDSEQSVKDRKKPKRKQSKNILKRLRESTSKLSFRDEGTSGVGYPQERRRSSLDSELGTRHSQDSQPALLSTASRTHLQDHSDEERQEPRRSRSGWRPSLSLIRQESSTFQIPQYPQNDKTPPSNGLHPTPGKKRARKKGKGKKRRKVAKAKATPMPQPARAPEDITLPTLTQVLEKKTRYPLSYDDFEAFLRNQRAVEYLNFWADVTAHEQLCRTFDVSERRRKREHQLEERALARDRRRLTFRASIDDHGRRSPDPEINPSNLYLTSRSSLQLPLNDHLSFPLENRRYGIQDSAAPFPPQSSGAYNRLLSGVGGRRTSGERSRRSLEEANTSDQDAVVAAIASRHSLRTYRQQPSFDQSREDIRRGSLDYRDNNNSSGYLGGSLAASTPNAYNMAMRGRGSTDILANRKLSASEDYFTAGIRRSPSQLFSPQQQQQQERHVQEEIAQLTQAVEESIQFSTGDDGSNGPRRQKSQHSLHTVEPSLARKRSQLGIGDGAGPLQPPLAIRRSGDSAFGQPVYGSGQEGRSGLLVQSYRTIGLEDLQESALRIYRKYLVQLRTASMAAEEEEAAIAASKESEATGLHRSSIDKAALAPGWEGYAEGVIAEWNENWQSKRSRRMSGRKSLSGREETYQGETITVNALSPSRETNEQQLNLDDLEANKEGEAEVNGTEPTSPTSKKMRRKTATGLGAMLPPFLQRLIRTETTVVELPTLTINTTTIEEVTAPIETDEDDDEDDSEDDDDEYDSDDEQEDGDNEEVGVVKDKQKTDSQKDSQHQDFNRTSNVEKNAAVERAMVRPAYTQKHRLEAIDAAVADEKTETIAMDTLHVDGLTPPQEFVGSTASFTSHPSTSSSPTPSATATAAIPQPIIAGNRPVSLVMTPSAATFYLPLECRQRIHIQVQIEGRTETPYLFGPAKGFVQDVVLQDHYYPLFLRHVKNQNMGLLTRHHVNNRFKSRGLVLIGVSIWAVVLAAQLTLVLLGRPKGLGGWSSPWVWTVGVVGGWTGSLVLATGVTGLSPLLGIHGSILEDRHLFRVRKIMEPSIRFRHRLQAIWMLCYCIFCSSVVMVIFASLPQREVSEPQL